MHNGKNAFTIACENANIDIVRLLIKHGVDIHHTLYNGASAFTIACENSNIDIVRLLVDNGIQIQQNNINNIFENVCENIAILRFLIGGDTRYRRIVNDTKNGFTIACKYNRLSVIQLLHEFCESSNYIRDDGDSVFYKACADCCLSIVSYLYYNCIGPLYVMHCSSAEFDIAKSNKDNDVMCFLRSVLNITSETAV